VTIALSAARLAHLLGPNDAVGPAYRDFAERIRLLVVDGRVPDGSRLPSERALAEALGVSRTTTTRVYTELRDTGLLHSRQGSGSVVRLPLSASHASSLIVTPNDTDAIAMTFSAPLAPPGMARAFEAAAAKLPGLLATTGYLPDGLPALREIVAQRYTDRGLPTDPGQIVVTSGAQGAISLLGRTILRPGQRIVVEGTSWPHAPESFSSAGTRLTSMPVGDSPWDPTALLAAVRSAPHTAAYIIPDFHNPTGAIMTDQERGAWARELTRREIVPIVDESLREVNLSGVELPPSFASYDPRAIIVDSMSKSYWGGLRIGWARVPLDLVLPLVQARMNQDLGTPGFEQLVVAELLTEGGQTAAAGRAALRTGRDHLLSELATWLPDIVAPCPGGGSSLWLTLPDRMSSRLTAAAARQGLVLTPGPRFFTSPVPVSERHLRLPFMLGPEVLTEAVRRLRRAYDEVTGNVGASGAPAPSPGTLELIA
jgi:DNA-binding transcriptional MocR family regulator